MATRIRNRVEDRDAALLINNIAIDDLNACGQIFQLRPGLAERRRLLKRRDRAASVIADAKIGGGCTAAGAAGAAGAGAFVGLVELCRGFAGARFGVCTLICGSGVSPRDTAAGGGSEGVCCDGVAPGGVAKGPSFCADAAPIAATIAIRSRRGSTRFELT